MSPTLPAFPAAPSPTQVPVPGVRVKPRLRGVSHQFATFVALGAGAVLVYIAPTGRAAAASAIYAASLATMLGVSAFYHRPWWPAHIRQWLKRLDHSAIFLLIAGTYTPFCMLALHGEAGTRLLAFVWGGAALGVLRAVFWPRAPRFIGTGIYIGLGWIALAFAPEIFAALRPGEIAALLTGGVLYSLGGLVYVLRRPDPVPQVFGYHEVFHALTLVAAACHFGCITSIVRSAG